MSGAIPPVAVAVNVTLVPTVVVDVETVKELIVGPLDVAENVMTFDVSCPFTVIVPEAGLAV